LIGLAVGYLWQRNSLSAFDPRTESLPLLIGLVPAIIGIIGVAWPYGMEPRELKFLLLDLGLSLMALTVLWTEAATLPWVQPNDPGLAWTSIFDQWVLGAGFAIIVALLVLGRRPGGLPLPQLGLLVAGLSILFTSDLLGEFGSDRENAVTISIAGYWLAVCLFVAMMHRSPAEVQTPMGRKIATLASFVTPLLLVLLAGLLIIQLARETRPESWILDLAPLGWLLGLIGVGAASLTTIADLREDREIELSDRLFESAEEGWIRALLHDSSDYLYVLDQRGKTLYASPQSQAVFGQCDRVALQIVRPSAAELSSIVAGVSARAVPTGPHEMLVRAADGSERYVEVHVRPLIDLDFQGFVVTASDTTDAKLLAARLQSSSYQDRITGLPTSAAMHDQLTAALTSREGGLSLAILDIVDFGLWNERKGRAAGDSILQAVGEQLESLPARVTAVARIGGDSFALLIDDDRRPGEVLTCLETLSRRLRGIVLPDGSEVDIRFRAGYTSVSMPSGALTADSLIDEADTALRRAKHSRHAMAVAYSPGMNEDLVRRLDAETLVREALSNERIVVHYQPVVSATDADVKAVESLVRIRAATGELIAPGSFMEAAEHSGLIEDLGIVVRRLALRDLPILTSTFGDDLRVSLNASGDELTQDFSSELIASAHANRLVVEVTESTVLAEPEHTSAVLQAIRAAGGLVAIDDFGTGYSSLSQIASLPCDILKIDRGFVASMLTDAKAMSLVRAMIQLGTDLGLRTVAEGVENADQAEALRALGCQWLQGFHFSRPLPLNELVQWADSKQPA
jgi:diguanylate cyclase (GGDEF)-like protein/PAS domain S-box-containing protein